MKANTPSKLEKVIAAGHLAVTSECGPPRGSDPEIITRKAELIMSPSLKRERLTHHRIGSLWSSDHLQPL